MSYLYFQFIPRTGPAPLPDWLTEDLPTPVAASRYDSAREAALDAAPLAIRELLADEPFAPDEPTACSACGFLVDDGSFDPAQNAHSELCCGSYGDCDMPRGLCVTHDRCADSCCR